MPNAVPGSSAGYSAMQIFLLIAIHWAFGKLESYEVLTGTAAQAPLFLACKVNLLVPDRQNYTDIIESATVDVLEHRR